MSASFTIDLDLDVLRSAEQAARERNTTLPEFLASQVRTMARNFQESRAGRTPITDELRGAVTLPQNFDEELIVADELLKKHGIQG